MFVCCGQGIATYAHGGSIESTTHIHSLSVDLSKIQINTRRYENSIHTTSSNVCEKINSSTN